VVFFILPDHGVRSPPSFHKRCSLKKHIAHYAVRHHRPSISGASDLPKSIRACTELFANANAIKKTRFILFLPFFFLQQTAISSRCAANSQLNKCSQDKRSMLGSSTPCRELGERLILLLCSLIYFISIFFFYT
jgi:hypothetical protein